MNRKLFWRGISLFIVAAVVIVLDQYTKWLVRRFLPLNVSWNPLPWLDPIVTLTHAENPGAAFGLFPGMQFVFVIVALAVVVAIIFYYRQLAAASWVLRLAFGLQLGGAIGNNLIDRLSHHYILQYVGGTLTRVLVEHHVTDFVDFRIWPVWNVADGSVVVGTIILAYYALFMDRPQPAKQPSPESSQTDSEHPAES